MLVSDRTVELQYANTVTIGTLGYRLSPKPCGHALKVTRGVTVCMTKNLRLSWSKGCQKKSYHPWIDFLMHYSSLRRCVSC